MHNLKSNLFHSVFFLLVSACQSTPAFKIATFPERNRSNLYDLHVIDVVSNRIQQKCLFLNAEDENQWRHQYFMYVLNDKNEVLEIMQSTNQDKDSCQIQLNKIEKNLKPESLVKLCVRGELKKNVPQSEDQDEFIKFGTLGGHKVVYEALTLDSICNSKECFSNNDVWVNTCPGFVKY